jgi:hypothetical protein
MRCVFTSGTAKGETTIIQRVDSQIFVIGCCSFEVMRQLNRF